VHLNFREEWRGTFQAVIFSGAWCDFPAPPEDLFLGREILVSGLVKEYRGAPEIVVDSPAQIRFADGGVTAANPPLNPLSGARPPPPARSPGLRVATWNLENFFDGWDDPYRGDETTEPAFVGEPRRRRIADALLQLDADVVCLQEVENRFVLEEFVAAYLPGSGYRAVLVEGNDERGIDVALLSRLPIEAVTSYRDRRFADAAGVEREFQRDLLRVRVGGGLQADVFVVHLKSQHGEEEADRIRAAEAREAAAIFRAELARDPEWRALIAGDFNDVLGEPPLDAFLAPRASGGAGLADLCAGTESPTYHQPPYVSRIDFLLATPALAAELAEAAVIERLPGVDLKCASDHYPVSARFAPR
jgi:endonuclease/exonuclease/phosphatase family metal-dependent hydrolase